MKNKFAAALFSLIVAFGIWLYVITTVSPGSEDTFSGIPVTPQCITLHNKTIILYYGSSPFSSENLADFPGFFSGIFPAGLLYCDS